MILHANLLASYLLFALFQLITYYLIANGLDSVRAIFGPMPESICSVAVFFKNVIQCNVAQFSILVTITRFTFVCVYKSIPVLNDQLFAHFLFASVNMTSFMIVTIVSVLPGKMPLNYVSSICM